MQIENRMVNIVQNKWGQLIQPDKKDKKVYMKDVLPLTVWTLNENGAQW